MKYTSLELSKKLYKNGCELESEHYAQEGADGCYFKYDILNDICVKYAKEFFGEEKIEYTDGVHLVVVWAGKKYEHSARTILSLLQQNKKQEAEDYIWEHCLFNPENKK